MWDGIYWLWDNLSEVSALLLLIKYYKKLDAKWAEKKKSKRALHVLVSCIKAGQEEQTHAASSTSLLGKAVHGGVVIQNSR